MLSGLIAAFAKLGASWGWPLAAIVIAGMIIWSIPRIGDAFRNAPMIRRIKLSSIEVELDRRELQEIKAETDKRVYALVSKIDDQVVKFSNMLNVRSVAQGAVNNVITSQPVSRNHSEKSQFRSTVHILDPVFKDQLFQLLGYFFEDGRQAFLDRDDGRCRRFSIRYGIIGLAARTNQSQGVGSAFRGDKDQTQALIERWSMLPEQTVSARRKPSCVAILLRAPDSGAPIGILYADAETTDFFGDDDGACDFAKRCEELPQVKKLAKVLAELRILCSELEIGFDLVRIGEGK